MSKEIKERIDIENYEDYYEIEIVETLSKMVYLKKNDFESIDDALKKVKEQYDSGDIVLDYSDYIDTKFNV